MNGREQMKAARAKALGRVRRPICASHQGQSNKYALELTLIELGASESEAFWAMYSEDPLMARAAAKARWGSVPLWRGPPTLPLTKGPLPLP